MTRNGEGRRPVAPAEAALGTETMRSLDLAPRPAGVERGLARPAYSRFVGLMKWGLPLLAALLVVLGLPGFAFAQTAKEAELEARVAPRDSPELELL